MLRLFIALAFGSLACFSANAQEKESKVKFTFGGRFDAYATYDSHQIIHNTTLEYIAPAAPEFNDFGEDISKRPEFIGSVASSVLNASATMDDILSAKAKVFVEIDFLGSGSAPIGVPRLRHGFLSLDWGKDKFLIGQTNALQGFDVAAPTVNYAAGNPYMIICRPFQARYTRGLGEFSKLDLALTLYSGINGLAQTQGLIPDFHARYMFGNPESFSAGITAGVTPMKPRTLTEQERLSSEYILGWDFAAYARYRFLGHSLLFYTIGGANLTHLNLMGGFAPLYNDVNSAIDDYGYGSTQMISLLLDYDTPRLKGWGAGLFLGYMKNLGSSDELYLDELYQRYVPNLEAHWRVQPRVTYKYKSLLFGLEYSYSESSWAEQMDLNYRPVGELSTSKNNRVVFLTRFTF